MELVAAPTAELPREIWYIIATALVARPDPFIRTHRGVDTIITTSPHIDPGIYWALVRVSRRFCWPNMQSVMLRTEDVKYHPLCGWLVQTVLPNGTLHSDGPPSITHRGGTLQWHRRGKLHRDGAPAIVTKYSAVWFQHGLVHREDGPALTKHLHIRDVGPHGVPLHHKDFACYSSIAVSRLEAWYRRGCLHREGDLPAVVYDDGLCAWFKNDKCYRRGHDSAVSWVATDGERQW